MKKKAALIDRADDALYKVSLLARLLNEIQEQTGNSYTEIITLATGYAKYLKAGVKQPILKK